MGQLMRIRQIRPEFFTDPLTAHMPAAVQITYIGLWCVADDAGWLAWDVPQIGALLYPYSSVHGREARVAKAAEALTAAGRLTILDCGCARIPTLTDHQKIGGNKSFPALERHRVHTIPDKSARNGRVSNVTVGNGKLEARASAREIVNDETTSFDEAMAAHGVSPAISKALQ
jgi:hypothetical protein